MPQCKESVMRGFHLQRCARKAVQDGEYCAVHSPKNKAARQLRRERELAEVFAKSAYAMACRTFGELAGENGFRRTGDGLLLTGSLEDLDELRVALEKVHETRRELSRVRLANLDGEPTGETPT